MTRRVKTTWRFKLPAVLIFLSVAAVSLYGGGAAEDTPLSRADSLIQNREYDEAIRVLTEYIKENPSRFNEAQSRLQRIVRIRERYNEIAGLLLDILENDPENSEEIFRLSQELIAIEPPSDNSTRLFLEQIQFVAELNVNRRRLESVLFAARIQLENNDFSGALNTYTSGLDIYQDVYFSSGYGQAAEETAINGLNGIDSNIRAFNNAGASFGGAARALSGMDAGALPDTERIEAAYSALLPFMLEIAELKTGFYAIRQSFEDQLAILQADDPALGDRSFLSFASALIAGPGGVNEGMAGTLERFWAFHLDPVEEILAGFSELSYNSGYAEMENRNYGAAVSVFAETGALLDVAIDLLEKWDVFLLTEGAPVQVVYGESISDAKAEDYLEFFTMARAVSDFRDIALIAASDPALQGTESSAFDSWRGGGIGTQAAVLEEQNLRNSYKSLINELAIVQNRINSEIAIAVTYGESTAGSDEGAVKYLAAARDAASGINRHLETMRYDAAVRLYTIANADLGERTAENEAEFNEGNAFLLGVEEELEGSGLNTAYYPAEGAAILAPLGEKLHADIASARSLVSQYASEDSDFLSDTAGGGLYASARGFLDRLLALETENSQAVVSAGTRVERAAALRFEGDRLYEAARAAVSRSDLDSARTSLTRASESYGASLAIQESASLRADWDSRLVTLGAEIVRIENEIVVRDVRNLLTDARARYYAGNMDEAEQLLVRAQNRWRVTNVIEHQEVELWLGLVKSALSLQSGRTIASTAPLFAEMSQLLSDARRNYDEGVRFIRSNRTSEGLARFASALEKTREIRLMFPMNHEARMLELRIEQQTDARAFNASFSRRLEEAVAGTKPSVRSMQSFADLQDLAEINPAYSGIRAILAQAEIDMGLRPPPPNPQDLARSAELARTAQAAVNARDSTRYEVAQAQLEEAIRLNPNNTQAQSLLDQVSVLMRGTGRFIMPTAIQLRYDQAVQLFNQGSYLQANAIIEQLLQNPDNQRLTLIQDLKRRIEAVL